MDLRAAGSGLNLVVVVNQASSNSVELANYYCEKRHVPPQNVLRATWAGNNIDWTVADFQAVIRDPLLSMLSARGLTNQIYYVLLSMDFPYRVTDGTSYNSTTAALYYGFKQDTSVPPGLPGSCSLPPASSNSYAGSELVFPFSPPSTAATNSFLTMMLTSSNLAEAKALADQGVTSDSTFPTQTVLLAHSSDVFRNARYATFDNAIFNTRLRGNYSMTRTNLNSPFGLNNLLGFQTGVSGFPITPAVFVPGAMADSLTSYGGDIFENSGQTALLAFINAGASGSYGTVVEPCAYLEKFPSPMAYFYQARGFTIAEAYYQSLTNPYQGLLVGEPLAAPFARAPDIAWMSLPVNAVLAGSTNLSLQWNSIDAAHPVQQVDLFVDGRYFQTVTNLSPAESNIVSVSLNGFSTNYMVPAGATIEMVASNLALRLNQSSFSNATKVNAYTHGDRIELQSFDPMKLGKQIPVSVSNSFGTATALTTWLSGSRSNLLDSTAYGIRSYYITNTPQNGDYIAITVIKNNGQTISVGVTNTTAGTTISQLIKSLFDVINTNATLQAADGIDVEDIVPHEDYAWAFGSDDHAVDFNVRARNAGWPASQVQVRISGSATFTFLPSGNTRLDQNVSDLRPRTHLYMAAGRTNLSFTFSLNTLNLPDGYHELTAVAYEGTHVRTEGHASRSVRFQNLALAAELSNDLGGTNVALESSVQFRVLANTNNIAKIELFSTGGTLGAALNQPSATFTVYGTNVGVGLHPFYALVTDNNGGQYRTDTTSLRFIGAEPAFELSITAPPPTLTWPATVGRHYNILGTTNLSIGFGTNATLVATNALAGWTDTNATGPRFYRVQTLD